MSVTSHRAERFGSAFGLLIAEFVVIVVGVLVALAVDEYVTAREERRRAATYHERLGVELQAMSENLSAEMETIDRGFVAARKLIEGLTSDPLAPADSLDRWLPLTFREPEWQPELVVLNTMIESGDIHLLGDQELQSALIRFRERSRTTVDRRALADDMIMEGFRLMTTSADFLVFGPRLFGTSASGDRWPWAELANRVTFRNGVYSAANGVRVHKMTLEAFAGDLELVRSAVEKAGS